ncbi:MAG TPA: hypothetical protein VOA87_09740 [Thermoanaerobaculia bacterium]|nr:hypothetical protein [Thermoanaerobaculia bacterium]
MAPRRKEREPEPWADPWTGWWWHSRPVARSLHVLKELDVLVRATGRTDKTPGFETFTVEIKVTPLTPCPYVRRDQHGNPTGTYLPGDTFYVSSRRDLHEVVKEALRRKEVAASEEEP